MGILERLSTAVLSEDAEKVLLRIRASEGYAAGKADFCTGILFPGVGDMQARKVLPLHENISGAAGRIFDQIAEILIDRLDQQGAFYPQAATARDNPILGMFVGDNLDESVKNFLFLLDVIGRYSVQEIDESQADYSLLKDLKLDDLLTDIGTIHLLDLQADVAFEMGQAFLKKQDHNRYPSSQALESLFKLVQERGNVEQQETLNLLMDLSADAATVLQNVQAVIDQLGKERQRYEDEIVRLNQLVRKVEQAAERDGLTGLFNRKAIESRVPKMMARVHDNPESGKTLACFMVDIDRFKDVNDRYGHLAGDEILKWFAQRLRGITREREGEGRLPDLAGRWGGEEFMILMEVNDNDDNGEILQEITDRICAKGTFTLEDGQEVKVSSSVGFATLRGEERFDSLADRADKALYNAKHSGRACLHAAHVDNDKFEAFIPAA